MDFMASNDELQRLTDQWDRAPATQRLALQAELAWQLRQRDCARARLLANQVQAALPESALGAGEQVRIESRLMLVQSEIDWLFGEFAWVQSMAETALHGFAEQDDAIGCADAHWMLARLAYDQGDMAVANARLEGMALLATRHDPVRLAVAQAFLARSAVYLDLASASASWGQHFTRFNFTRDPAALCWISDFFAVVAEQGSDYLQAIEHWTRAHGHADNSGQIARVITIATHIGDAFNNLNDYQTALEWLQRALDLARHSGWPGMVAWALIQSAETQRRMRHYDAAHELLTEALALMEHVKASRNYALALYYFGSVELARQQYASALATFETLEQRTLALKQSDLLYAARRGQAQALLELGRPEPALRAAHLAMAGASAHADYQIAALRTLAEIHARHALPAPADLHAASVPLHYLQKSLVLARTIDNYTIPGDLLDFVAQEYANVGDHVRAYDYARQASLAREKTHGREASARAMALQISHATEQAQREIEQHKQLAMAEARRARLLQETQQQMVLQGKMAGLGSLTAGVAHEINNPTNFVHVAAQNQLVDLAEFQRYVADLVEQDEAPEVMQGFAERFERLRGNVATILNGTERIKGIVRDLRAFTRMDSEKKKSVKLSDCLVSTLNLVRTSWQEQVEFITEFEPDAEMLCWPALLNQVFMNLLVNGCQAIAERIKAGGGSPGSAGSAGDGYGARGKMWLRLARRGAMMQVQFEDNGIGIEPAVQERIMEPFYTTKEVGSGTGLGLSIAFDIIEKHGGRLLFTSTPGSGSCFTILLPLTQ
jgi:signal transduction histidine kinase